MQSTTRLILQVGEASRSRLISVPMKERMILGRGSAEDGEMPDLDFSALNAAAQGMSRLHAVFTYQDDLLYLEDLNSTNGTRINGFTITPGRSYLLRNGDELEFGSFLLTVRVVRAAAGARFS